MKVQIGWYVIADAQELKPNRPLGVRRFGADWVVWRDRTDKPVAMPDRCPHRSAKLSLGSVHEGEIQCPYHGIRFNGDGHCTLVPEIGRLAPGLRVHTANTVEAHGFIWVWIGGDKAAEGVPPWFNERPGKFLYTGMEASWPVPHRFWIENELDVAHLPFVHRKTIGRGRDPLIRTRFAFSAEGMTLFFSPEAAPSHTGSFIEFLYPGIWQLGISNSMYQVIAFVPVEENLTKVYLRTYRSFGTHALVRPLVSVAMGWYNRRVLAEDQAVVTTQRFPQPNENLPEVLFGQDVGIRHYRDLAKDFIEFDATAWR